MAAGRSGGSERMVFLPHTLPSSSESQLRFDMASLFVLVPGSQVDGWCYNGIGDSNRV